MDQRQLVERAREGDHDAFAQLARAAVVRLDKAARLILRDPELARDAVQETLIRAWRDLPKLREPDRFEAWLHRLTVNACLDQARKRGAGSSRSSSRRSPISRSRTAPTPGRIESWSTRSLQRLDDHGRAIVVLHYYLGMPLSDVAVTLGIPIGTVKSRLHRALGEMRLAIGPEPSLAPRRREGSRHDDRASRRPGAPDGARRPRRERQSRLPRRRPHRHGADAPAAGMVVDPALAPHGSTRGRTWLRPCPWRGLAVALVIIALLVASLALLAGSAKSSSGHRSASRRRAWWRSRSGATSSRRCPTAGAVAH